jgi:hypothetical protein
MAAGLWIGCADDPFKDPPSNILPYTTEPLPPEVESLYFQPRTNLFSKSPIFIECRSNCLFILPFQELLLTGRAALSNRIHGADLPLAKIEVDGYRLDPTNFLSGKIVIDPIPGRKGFPPGGGLQKQIRQRGAELVRGAGYREE